jgi:distribution and morphology protein 10
MGFLSTAYSAQISPHLALSSRYGVNVYSYESDLCVGGEWWIGSGRGKGGWRGLRGVMGDEPVEESASIVDAAKDVAHKSVDGGESRSFMQAMRSHTEPAKDTDRDGVLKAKIQGNGVSHITQIVIGRSLPPQLVSLLYESRIRKCLVSVGVVSDLSSRSNPIRTIGMEVQYFSD